MSTPVQCTVCLTTFSPKSGNQLYCSHECRDVDLTRECLRCKTKFKVVKRSRKTAYCSKSCAVASCNEEGIMGKQAKQRNLSDNRINLTCFCCGKQFSRILSQVRKSQKKGTEKVFCDMTCYSNYLSMNTEQRYCAECNQELPLDYKSKNKKFCSKDCQIKHHRVEFNCKHCGKEGTKIKSQAKDVNNLFCDKYCLRDYKLNNSKSIENNHKNSYITFRTKITNLKEFKEWKQTVLEKYNNECKICKSKEELHVHHLIPLSNIIEKYCNGNYGIEEYRLAIKDELIFNPNNGVVLCKEHHMMCHNI